MSFSKSKLKLVKLKHSVKAFVVSNNLKSEIIKEIQLLENYQTLMCNPEFLRYVCNLVEASFSYKTEKEKVDKKAIVLDIFRSLFPNFNSGDNVCRTSVLIEYLHNNGDISKLSNKTLVIHTLKSVGNFFLRKA